jgi:Fe-S-cluster containining protein
VALRVDEPGAAAEPPAQVDCAARMHVCHSVCCKLDFALSAEEVEQGVVRWDLGRPYLIRHAETGYCVHNDRATGGCGVYADRPQVCRAYSCAGDKRIWKDFDAMELNTEWLEENLVGVARPLLLQAMLARPVAEGKAAPAS